MNNGLYLFDMKESFELTGLKFNRWIVLKRLENKRSNRYWLCQCECGRTSRIPTYYLTKGYSKQCVYCSKHQKDLYSDECPNPFWKRIQWNAKKRNIELKITKTEAYNIFLKQNRKCKLTGVLIRFPKYATDNDWTASLDRIDCKKHYTSDNIQWIHKDVNRMKNVFDEEYFIEICNKVSKFNKKRK